MKLTREQIEDVAHITISQVKGTLLEQIDSNIYVLTCDQLDDIISEISKCEAIMTEDQFKRLIVISLDYNRRLIDELTTRGFTQDEIVLQFIYSQNIIMLKLRRLSRYFKSIEFYEGCANIKRYIDFYED